MTDAELAGVIIGGLLTLAFLATGLPAKWDREGR